MGHETMDATSKPRPRPRSHRLIAMAAAAIMLGSLISVATGPATRTQAAVGSQFNPGNIITDGTFYNTSTLTPTQIQAFLNAKVPTCAADATCLKSYSETTYARPASTYCGSYAGIENQTAAAIIYAVAQACGVNPQVLIVLLQKEQGLVTSVAPAARAYRSATGYGCPDSAACDTTYYGFYNQVYMAARQFKIYRTLPNNFSYRAGRVNTIKWHPNPECGTSQVYIENQATAGLYNYTPYRPNAAALDNMAGLGDACSSYGNRNFYRYFIDWFGAFDGPPPTTMPNPTVGEPASYLLDQDIAGGLWLHPNDGFGTLQAGGQVGAGWGSMSPTFSGGDFNGDGHEDILSRDGNGDLWMYPRDGAGGWLARVLIGSSWQGFTAIFSARDFNGDTHQDVMARDTRGDLWLYPGNGAGGWLARVYVGNSWQGFSSLFGSGDFNGDSYADVIARDPGGSLWLYRGNGHGGWLLPRVEIGSSWQNFVGVSAAGDFSGDGHPDVLARDPAGALWLYKGNGTGGWILPAVSVGASWLTHPALFAVGNFGDDTPVPPTPGGPSNLGDFTGDGKRDLLARDASGATTLYTGTGTGSLGSAVPSGISEAASSDLFYAGDFNGDGFQDVFNRVAGDLYLYPGTGTGSWGPKVLMSSGWQGFTAIFIVGDFNGDSFGDVMGRDSRGDLYLYPGNGTGSFLPRSYIGSSWQGFTSVFGAGDFSGDGFVDLLTRDGAGDLYLYRGNGHGGWLPRIYTGSSWQGFVSVASAGDFNGDGHPDVFARDSSGSLWLYTGNGASAWIMPRTKVGGNWLGFGWVG